MNYSLKKHLDNSILNYYEDILDLKSIESMRELNEEEKKELYTKEKQLEVYREIKSICENRKRY